MRLGINEGMRLNSAIPRTSAPICICVTCAYCSFYSFHCLATLVSSALAIVHLVALHLLGSTPGYLLHDTNDTIPFSRYYLIKDAILLALVYILYLNILYTQPTLFSDVELNISINTMATPPHIVPEWYLLAYYATLRGIPSKALGVIMVALVLVSIFYSVIPSLYYQGR